MSEIWKTILLRDQKLSSVYRISIFCLYGSSGRIAAVIHRIHVSGCARRQRYFLLPGFSACSTRSVLANLYRAILYSRCFLYRSEIGEMKIKVQYVLLELAFRHSSARNKDCTHDMNGYSDIFSEFKVSPTLFDSCFRKIMGSSKLS